MQIVIPMSGFGERFRNAGYDIPKPLIQVEGKPIIQHVCELFSKDDSFLFICNKEHLSNPDYRMKEIINSFDLNSSIIPIDPHALGPVHAVLECSSQVDLSSEVIVNYCDFTCRWDYQDFKKFKNQHSPHGIIPAYRGFHPHTLWSNYYAYLQTADDDLTVQNVQEKMPFTSEPTQEFASSGTYYFKTGQLMLEAFEEVIRKNLLVNNEFYVSMSYMPLIEDQKKILTYEIEHFMQWGTPQDLDEYNYWSSIFKYKGNHDNYKKNLGTLIVPMGGLGNRFVNAGYKDIKPLIHVNNKPMIQRSLDHYHDFSKYRFIYREDEQYSAKLASALTEYCPQATTHHLKGFTDGQASTVLEGTNEINDDELITIAACDNGIKYSLTRLQELIDNSSIDVIVWTIRGYPFAVRKPEMYGWVQTDDRNIIESVSVKQPLLDPTQDPIVLGTFTFKSMRLFRECIARMKSRHGKINGEYYIDNCINDAIELGLNCVNFEADHYLSWGTPEELNTFEYWQNCFSKWPSHPYDGGPF